MADERGHYEDQTYICMAVGHPDEDREFEAAEERWWMDKGLSLPLSCPECRTWYRAQLKIGSIDSACFMCGYHWPTEPLFRISYRKRRGNWEEYVQSAEGQTCLRCANDPHRQQKMKNRNAMLRLQLSALNSAKKGKMIEFPPARDAFVVPGADDLEFYERTKLYSKDKVVVKNQLEHLLSGKDGKQDHKWKKKLGSSDSRPFIAAAAKLAGATGRDVAQINQRNGYILKCDMHTGLVVIVKPDTTSDTGHSLETAYFNERPDLYVEDKMGKRR